MLEGFTVETFLGAVGDRFTIGSLGADPISAELVEARSLGAPHGERAEPSGGRAPFALLFRGPREPILPQRIYRLEHDDIGAFDLFLVPVGVEPDGARYEAVFG